MQLAGRFLCEAIGPDDNVRRSTGWFDNIVTDVGLNGIAVRGMTSSCWCGTGTATPTAVRSPVRALPANAHTRGQGAYRQGARRRGF